MKRKLQLALLGAATLFAGAASAQTDVTSTYLTNPSFELGTTGTAASTGKGQTTPPYAWTVTGMSTSYSDFQILSASETSNTSASAFGVTVTPADGSYYYFGRHSWNTSLTTTLSQQTISSLPAGNYLMSVSYKIATRVTNSLGSLIASVSDGTTILGTATSVTSEVPSKAYSYSTYFNNASWSKLAVPFTVTTEGKATINLQMAFNPQKVKTDQEAIIIDDVRLYDLSAANITNPINVSGLVNNQDFNLKIAGWTTTTGAQNSALANNQTGAFTGNFWENWNGLQKQVRCIRPSVMYLMEHINWI